MGKAITRFARDDYNKELGIALIDANNDAEAISSFLQEYKDSPETLRSYTKEIESLLLWCIHVTKVNISSLRRDHLLEYQAFLKNPQPKKTWCGSRVCLQFVLRSENVDVLDKMKEHSRRIVILFNENVLSF